MCVCCLEYFYVISSLNGNEFYHHGTLFFHPIPPFNIRPLYAELNHFHKSSFEKADGNVYMEK